MKNGEEIKNMKEENEELFFKAHAAELHVKNNKPHRLQYFKEKFKEGKKNIQKRTSELGHPSKKKSGTLEKQRQKWIKKMEEDIRKARQKNYISTKGWPLEHAISITRSLKAEFDRKNQKIIFIA